jgi:hypothetical protein
MSAMACIGYVPSVVTAHNFIAHWAEESMARENLDACASQNEHIDDWRMCSGFLRLFRLAMPVA